MEQFRAASHHFSELFVFSFIKYVHNGCMYYLIRAHTCTTEAEKQNTISHAWKLFTFSIAYYVLIFSTSYRHSNLTKAHDLLCCNGAVF